MGSEAADDDDKRSTSSSSFAGGVWRRMGSGGDGGLSFLTSRKQQLPPLPLGWEEHDAGDGTGDVYFWNTETNETSWDRPVGKGGQEENEEEEESAVL